MREFWHKHSHGDTNKEKKKKQMSWFCAILCAKQSVFRFLDDFLIFARVPFYFCSVLCHSDSEFVFICLFTLDVLSSFLGHYFTHVMLCTNIFIIVFFFRISFFLNIVRNSSFFRVWMESYAVRLFHIPLTLRERNAWSIILKRNSINWMWHNLHVSCRTVFHLIEKIQFFAISSCSRFFFRAILFSYFLHLWITLANFKWNL